MSLHTWQRITIFVKEKNNRLSDMESFHDLLVRRHSIRRFTDEPVDADHVRLILEAGLMAPSSKRSMPWEFLVVEDKEKLQQMSGCREIGTVALKSCPLAIFVMADPEKSEAWVEDASVAAILMQLQAEDLGLGSCWVNIRGRFTSDPEITSQDYLREIVDIPGNLMVQCIIAIGHKDEERKPFDPEKLKWEKVHIATHPEEE